MNFYGSMPESYNITVNMENPLVAKIWEAKQADVKPQGELPAEAPSDASEAETAERFIYSILTRAPFYRKRDVLSDIIADKDSSRQRAEAFLDSSEELLLTVIKDRRFNGRAVSDATWETLIPAAGEIRNCRKNIRQLHSVAYSLKQLCLRV